METVHPYAFVSRQGFRELLETDDCAEKVVPLLNKIVPHIRAALVSVLVLNGLFGSMHLMQQI